MTLLRERSTCAGFVALSLVRARGGTSSGLRYSAQPPTRKEVRRSRLPRWGHDAGATSEPKSQRTGARFSQRLSQAFRQQPAKPDWGRISDACDARSRTRWGSRRDGRGSRETHRSTPFDSPHEDEHASAYLRGLQSLSADSEASPGVPGSVPGLAPHRTVFRLEEHLCEAGKPLVRAAARTNLHPSGRFSVVFWGLCLSN